MTLGDLAIRLTVAFVPLYFKAGQGCSVVHGSGADGISYPIVLDFQGVIVVPGLNLLKAFADGAHMAFPTLDRFAWYTPLRNKLCPWHVSMFA